MATAGQRAVAALVGSSRSTHALTGAVPVPPGAVSPRNVALSLANAAFDYYDRRRAHRLLQEQVAQEGEERSLRLAKLRQSLEPEPTESVTFGGRTFSGLTHNQAATLVERNNARGGATVETISPDEAKALGLEYGPGMTRFVARQQLSDRRRRTSATASLGEIRLRHQAVHNRITELDAAEKNYVQERMMEEDSRLEAQATAARGGSADSARVMGIPRGEMQALVKDPIKLDRVVSARAKQLRSIYENTHRARARQKFAPQRQQLLDSLDSPGAAPAAGRMAPARDPRVEDANSELDSEDF